MSSVQNIDRDYAPAWRPAPGDTLVGTVTDISSRGGGYGEYPIIVVRPGETMDTEVAFHAIHTVAQNELASKKPQVGETIAIKYVGKRKAASGNATYHAYKIVIDRDAGEFDWSRYGDDRADGGMPRAEADVKRGSVDDVPF
jgi:hypothetical protein